MFVFVREDKVSDTTSCPLTLKHVLLVQRRETTWGDPALRQMSAREEEPPESHARTETVASDGV